MGSFCRINDAIGSYCCIVCISHHNGRGKQLFFRVKPLLQSFFFFFDPWRNQIDIVIDNHTSVWSSLKAISCA